MKEIIIERELSSEEIKDIRKLIVDAASNIDSSSGKRLKLSDINCSKELLDKIIFDKRGFYKEIFDELGKLMSKIDFDGVSFDRALIHGRDFTGSKGVKINPQTIYGKKLNRTKFTGVKFIGPFDYAEISGANFTGSKGAKINPQTIWFGDLSNTVCSGVKFIGPFHDARISGANFTGSKGAEINPQTIFFKSLSNTVCSGVEFIGPFDDARISGANFTGSKGAKINPQTICGKNLLGTICADVKFTGSFDDVKMNDETSLDGSNARYIDIDSCERVKKSIKKLIK